MRRSDHPTRPSAINCCFVCSFKTLPTSTQVIALTPELTSWFSGLSVAGFEVTLYGRIWVTPEADPLQRYQHDIIAVHRQRKLAGAPRPPGGASGAIEQRW